MRASLIAYWAAKEGSSAAEYEDAWQVLPGTADEVPGNWAAIAVADGATESLLARRWAAMTADEFALARTAVSDASSFAEHSAGPVGALACSCGVIHRGA